MPDLKPLRIGVALSVWLLEQDHQPGLFDKPRDARLVTAVDELNAKFGKGAITYGTASADQTSKIAFQRVPRWRNSEGRDFALRLLRLTPRMSST